MAFHLLVESSRRGRMVTGHQKNTKQFFAGYVWITCTVPHGTFSQLLPNMYQHVPTRPFTFDYVLGKAQKISPYRLSDRSKRPKHGGLRGAYEGLNRFQQ